MRIVGKSKMPEDILTRSAPGIPDVKKISCAALAGSLTKFAAQYLRGIATVIGPPDIMQGRVGISPSQLGYALRVTVDKLSLGEPVVIRITEWDDEMNVRIEAAGLDSLESVAEVVKVWRSVGFKPRSCGLTLHLSIPLDKAFDLVVRESSEALFEYLLNRGYFYDL